MKKLIVIIAGILAGIAWYIWQDPQLSKKVQHQAKDLVTPETTTVYKWQDASGQWQLSNRPPPGDTPYQTLEYQRDTNVIPSIEEKKTRK